MELLISNKRPTSWSLKWLETSCDISSLSALLLNLKFSAFCIHNSWLRILGLQVILECELKYTQKLVQKGKKLQSSVV